MRTNFSGFVLAGGKSSRMKTDKAFLQIGGESFLRRAANALAPVCRKVKIVINQSQKEKFARNFPFFDFVFDVFPSRGATGGVHAALTGCESDFAVVLACDLPFVTGKTIEKLAEIAVRSDKKTAAIVPVQPDGRFQPLCAVYKSELCLPVVEKLLEREKSASMRDFLALIQTEFIDWKQFGEDENLFANVNHPFEYERLRIEKPA